MAGTVIYLIVNGYIGGKMPAATIQDVAKIAGVSVATVSRVLNQSSSVAKNTRDVVLEAIKQLDYRPNFLARNLRRTETKMVLVLLPTIANPFYSRIVKGIEDVALKNGYNVMLCNTDSDVGRERVYIELLKDRRADGIIFMAPEMDEQELTALGAEFPVVQCCEYKESVPLPLVAIDNFDAAEKATRHLLSLGHRRIGLITCRNSFVSTIRREQGYKSALEAANIEPDEQLVTYGDYSFKSGQRAAIQLLGMKDRPTAIFAISDTMAIGALRAAREKSLFVPEDLAVLGFDNISFASMCDPMLTTVSQPKYDLGCTAMDLLLREIRGELKEPMDIVLENELIIRESTMKSK